MNGYPRGTAATHLLDTNSRVDHLRRGPASKVTARLAGAVPGSVVLCSVVVAELPLWRPPQHTQGADVEPSSGFCRQFQSLAFDDVAAEEFGRVRAHLAGLGTPIGPNDLMIASIALARGLTLVTHNTAEFSRVPGVNLEDWQ